MRYAMRHAAMLCCPPYALCHATCCHALLSTAIECKGIVLAPSMAEPCSTLAEDAIQHFGTRCTVA